jgi:hypothetical protein
MGYTTWYDDLIEALPRETKYGWAEGAIGKQTIIALIKGNKWGTYAPLSVGDEIPPIVPQGAAGSREETPLLIDVGKAIKGKMTANDSNELAGQINDYINNQQRTITRFLKDIGVSTKIWGDDIDNDSKSAIIASLQTGDITIDDILAYNLSSSPLFPTLVEKYADDSNNNSDTNYFQNSNFRSLYNFFTDTLNPLDDDELEAELALERQRQAREGAKEAAAAFDKDDEEIISDIKFNLQEMLTNNLDAFANSNQTIRNKLVSNYKKTFMLDGPPSELINKLTYVPGSEKLLNLTVAEASALVPMIRLFKVYYDDKGQYETEQEMIFKTHVSELDLLAGTADGRSGVGIKSFDWQYNGSSPATVKNDITAKLVLYFQNFNDLLVEQPGGFRYVDLLIRTSPDAKKQQTQSIEEGSELEECVPDEISKNPKHYEIKATVGWANNSQYALEVSQDPGLAKAISYQQTSLFLTLLEHEFSISQEGTFELTINYRGRIDGLLMDKKADVLQSKQSQIKICRIENELKDAKEGCADDVDVEKLEEKLASEKAAARIDSYQEILYELINTDRVYFVSVSKETFEAAKNKISNLTGADLNIQSFAPISTGTSTAAKQDLLDQATDQMAEDETHVIQGGCGVYENAIANAAGNLFGIDKAEECYNAKGDEMATKPYEYTNKTTERYGVQVNKSGDIIIPYFFFGDLVDIVSNRALGDDNGAGADEDSCANAFNPNTVEHLKVILGSLELPDIATKSTVSEVKNINLGDVPIALPVFLDWWARNITQEERTNYPLIKFLRDMMNDVVVMALGDGLYDGNKSQQFIIKEASISLPCNQSFTNQPPGDPIAQRIGPQFQGLLQSSRLNTQLIDNQHPLRSTNQPNLTVNDMYHYKVFYMVNTAPTYLQGDAFADEQRGIPHLVMGAPRGLLKSANFARASFTGLREQRVIEEDSYNPLSHLADVYEIDVKLIGNTIFWPGQLLFMNPLGFGTKLGMPTTPGSVSRQLGLGGYHTVTQVSNFIQDGKFETSIKGLWETSGGQCARRKPKQSTEPNVCLNQTTKTGASSPPTGQADSTIELPE